ncbi:MAG: VCBS repeat-containing protein, partial [Akkermansiaceae bacterium]
MKLTTHIVPLAVLSAISTSPFALAQFSFTDETDLLSENVRSGVPMAVADMNGDGRDDLVRLHDTRTLSIEYQAAPGAP